LSVVASVIGGAILVVSAALFLTVLIRGHLATPEKPPEYRFSVAVHPPRVVSVALNGYGLWVGLMLLLTAINYGFPIAYLMSRHDTSVPVIHIGAGR
jgi:cytochrome c oxidase subunit 1